MKTEAEIREEVRRMKIMLEDGDAVWGPMGVNDYKVRISELEWVLS